MRATSACLESIGKFGWNPFMVAGVGNLLGGWGCGILIKRGCSITIARKSTVTFFAVLMLSAIPAVLASNVWVSIGLLSIAMGGYTGALAVTLSFPSYLCPR